MTTIPIKGTGYPDYSRRLTGTSSVRVTGSLSRVVVTGSLGRVGTIGALSHVGTISARYQERGTLFARHTAVGSQYTGPWEDVSRFSVKTYAVTSALAGSLHIVTGLTGTGAAGHTGTAYRVNLGAGSFHPVSFSEAFRFARAIAVMGSVAPGKGTLRVSRVFEV